MKSVEHYVQKFVPENYNIFLDINRETKSFLGNVAINGEALDYHISLHQKDLIVTSILLDNEELQFSVDDENDSIHVDLPDTGMMTLVIEFSGHITDNMTGIYPSYYQIDGQRKEIISTQFESHFAREAFPCIDEPEAKATFDLSLKFDQKEGEVCLSNMPESNVSLREETGLWTFETTPRMSSYLLAFAFGELHGKVAKTKNGTSVGVYATTSHPLTSVDFSLDIAVRVIDFYENYFGIKYPIPHSFHVGLPDFSAGAMENWGLITYREIYLLVDKNSTVSSRQQVALVVAHEIAHQWFGNLVTMKWWDDLWLNESFANMMEYVSVDAIEPDWNIFEDFQTSGVPLALKRDATDGVQSVHVTVNHPDEINTLFDPAIVYAKGSRLMHMLRRWLGDKDFAAGLKVYFERHQYHNTIGQDLWRALSETSGKDVSSFMDAWLEQPGYPVVTAEVVDNNLVISQEQFFIGEGENKDRVWPIPLNATWEEIPETLNQKEIIIPNFDQLLKKYKGALRFNTENTAHFISNYKGPLFLEILKEFSQLDKTSKAQVLQERRLLSESGREVYADLIPVVAELTEAKSYLEASAISQIISALKDFVDDGSAEEQSLKHIVNAIFLSDLKRLGFEKHADESDEDEMIRRIMLSQLLFTDHLETSQFLDNIYTEYQNSFNEIPAALRRFVLINQIKHHESDALIQTYFENYVNTKDNNIRIDITMALAYTKSHETISRILVSLKDKDIIKPQDLSSWYNALLSHDFTQDYVWDWARTNWEWIKDSLGGDMSFDKFVIYPASHFKTKVRLTEFKDFFQPQLDDMAISRNIVMGINEITAKLKLMNQQKDTVEYSLRQY